MKKNILLLEDDPKTVSQISAILRNKCEMGVAPDAKSALSFISKQKPLLLILDLDMFGGDGLGAYKRMLGECPQLKTVMLSSINDVSLAVAAAKLGVIGFLRKPLEADDLVKTVEEAMSSALPAVRLSLSLFEDVEWLYGASKANVSFLKAVEQVSAESGDVVLLAGQGVDCLGVADIIHQASPNSQQRKLAKIDLRYFQKEPDEARLWNMLQELLSKRDDIPLKESHPERAGTLVLSGFEDCAPPLKKSILDFVSSGKRSGKLDPNVRIVVVVRKQLAEEKQKDFRQIKVPSLKERKEDLPILLELYLNKYAKKYLKPISDYSIRLASFLAYYDFPGNYFELDNIVKLAVLNCNDEVLGLKHLGMNWDLFSYIVSQKVFSSLDFSLENLRRSLERDYMNLVLKIAGHDENLAARFMDIPKSVFDERKRELSL